MKNLNHKQNEFDFFTHYQSQELTKTMMYHVRGGDGGVTGGGTQDPPPPPPPPSGL
ncbi:MAG: hypothetical protein K9H49_07445 [Bacteroidales bacterium]|nr:hypothetical protein [Bacteroidales bacterium]MCF8391997.1 hypothetical protein [Bacteroidales bacterium]